MIQETNISFLMPPIFAMAERIPDITPEQFKENVLTRLAEKDSKMIIAKKDDEILGFIFCTVDKYRGESAYVIQYAYVKPDAYSAGAELMARACVNAKKLGLNSIYMMTSRNPEGFIRKYKFEHFMTVLKRSL